MYTISGFYGFADVTTYGQGCQGDTHQKTVDVTLTAPSKGELLDKVRQYFGVDPQDAEAIQLDEGEEVGRIDVQVYETGEGYYATAADFAAWKEGKRTLWLVTYTGNLTHNAPTAWGEV